LNKELISWKGLKELNFTIKCPKILLTMEVNTSSFDRN